MLTQKAQDILELSPTKLSPLTQTNRTRLIWTHAHNYEETRTYEVTLPSCSSWSLDLAWETQLSPQKPANPLRQEASLSSCIWLHSTSREQSKNRAPTQQRQELPWTEPLVPSRRDLKIATACFSWSHEKCTNIHTYIYRSLSYHLHITRIAT